MSRHSDPLDAAADTAELLLQSAISKREPTPPASPYCLNCLELTDNPRFCDSDCADDYNKRYTRR